MYKRIQIFLCCNMPSIIYTFRYYFFPVPLYICIYKDYFIVNPSMLFMLVMRINDGRALPTLRLSLVNSTINALVSPSFFIVLYTLCGRI